MESTVNKYILVLSFKGTDFYGWQIQPKSVSVQAVLENTLGLLLKEEIKLCGAGRTDKGVHASYYIAHFTSLAEISDNNNNFLFRLNKALPKDIFVGSIKKTSDSFHARYSAVSRSYQYIVARKKVSFMRDYSSYIYGELDIESMQKCAGILKEYNDFSSFSRLYGSAKTNICSVSESEWIDKGDFLIYRISADRFLRNMVRAITGTLLEIGSGKRHPGEFRSIIEKKDRSYAGKSAEAKGLFLTGITYPQEYGLEGPIQEFPDFLIK